MDFSWKFHGDYRNGVRNFDRKLEPLEFESKTHFISSEAKVQIRIGRLVFSFQNVDTAIDSN